MMYVCVCWGSSRERGRNKKRATLRRVGNWCRETETLIQWFWNRWEVVSLIAENTVGIPLIGFLESRDPTRE